MIIYSEVKLWTFYMTTCLDTGTEHNYACSHCYCFLYAAFCAVPTLLLRMLCGSAYINNAVFALLNFLPLLQIFFWKKEKIQRRDYATSYNWMVEKTKNSTLYTILWFFGPRYRKPLYVAGQAVYTLFSMFLAYPCFH